MEVCLGLWKHYWSVWKEIDTSWALHNHFDCVHYDRNDLDVVVCELVHLEFSDHGHYLLQTTKLILEGDPKLRLPITHRRHCDFEQGVL